MSSGSSRIGGARRSRSQVAAGLTLVHVRVHVAHDRKLDIALAPAKRGTGPTSIIWCTAGVRGMCVPAIGDSRAPDPTGDHHRLGFDVPFGRAHPPHPPVFHIDPKNLGLGGDREGAWSLAALAHDRAGAERVDDADRRVKAAEDDRLVDVRQRGLPRPGSQGIPARCPMRSRKPFVASAPAGAPRCARPRCRRTAVKTPISLYWLTLSTVRPVLSFEWSTR